jgi:hypothetical protein
MAKTQIQVLELWNNAKKGQEDVEKLYEEAVKLVDSEEDSREKQFANQVLRRFHRWKLTSPKAAR